MSEQPFLLSELIAYVGWDREREANYRVNVVDALADLCAAVKSRPLEALRRSAVEKARHVVNQLYVGTFTEDGETLLAHAEQALHAIRDNDPAEAGHLKLMNAMLQRLRMNVLADRR
jgi:hypothetical protein